MKKSVVFFLLSVVLGLKPFLAQSETKRSQINVLHYNIKELDSLKIREREEGLGKAVSIIKKISFDILSLNEIQYDFPGIPYKSFQTEGKNLSLLGQWIDPSLKDWFELFHPGNTGFKARKRADGTYFPDLKKRNSRRFADPVNFGVFPGQYAMGGLSRFPIKKMHYIHKVRWKDIFPERNLSLYKDAHGKNLPEDIPLFDKVFIHAVLDVKGHDLHLILLHTVPSFNFGNPYSVNIVRNSDQIRFLKTYLEGKILGLPNLRGLPSNAPFIVMGDLNVDYRDLKKEGAQVMKSLLELNYIKALEVEHTYESEGIVGVPRKLLLDYILYGGKGLELKEGGVFGLPSGKLDLGCHKKRPPKLGKVIVTYQKRGKECYLEVNSHYFQAKKASDHFPLYARFYLKKEL